MDCCSVPDQELGESDLSRYLLVLFRKLLLQTNFRVQLFRLLTQLILDLKADRKSTLTVKVCTDNACMQT